MRIYLIIFLVILLIIRITACGDHHNQKTSQEIITVTSQPLTTHLFYSGIIQPYQTIMVTSPADGVIETMAFNFGDMVKKGQLLFRITSQKFQSDYKTALTQYIKAKDEFNTARNQLNEATFLHKNQLISEDEFKSKKAGFYNAQLNFLQTKDALALLLKKINLQEIDLYQLSIQDVDKITQALHLDENVQTLQIFSPVEGLALLPEKNDANDSTTKKIMTGDQVKQGDVVAVIGNANGLAIAINVNEFNVNQLKYGQHVKVTGLAFPQFVLKGEVKSIERQGIITQTGIPVFPVGIVIPSLTPEQKRVIHIGMSAKVEINIERPSQVTIPITAVFQKNGNTYVRVQDKKTGKIIERQITTGQTTADSVVVLTNLHEGERIVITH